MLKGGEQRKDEREVRGIEKMDGKKDGIRTQPSMKIVRTIRRKGWRGSSPPRAKLALADGKVTRVTGNGREKFEKVLSQRKP